MVLTPFQYLKQNIDKLNFSCEEKYIEEYKRAFSNVLERMDKYFLNNNLYQCGDYQSYVENMLKEGSFTFMVTDEPQKNGAAAFHQHLKNDKNRICFDPEYMGHGTITEGVLCHEFFHQLTLGNPVLKYVSNGKYTEISLPQKIGGHKLNGRKLVWGQDKPLGHAESVEMLSVGDALDGGFICEALTELSKQRIYSEEECYFSYTPQTSMIKFVNSLIGTDLSMANFLRGDLPNYIKAMGRKNFIDFNEACERFQTKFKQNYRIDYINDEDYKKAQDIVVDTILDKINSDPEKYNPKELARLMAIIKYCAPINGRDDIQVDETVKDYTKEFATKKGMSQQEALALRKLIFKTMLKQATHEQDKFQLPNRNISFKQTKSGFKIAFNDEFEIDLTKYIGVYETKLVVKNPLGYNAEIDINNGNIKIHAQKQFGLDETIQIKVDNKLNPQKLLITDKSGQIHKLDFIVERQKREAELKLNQNLLENAECISDIRFILANNSDVQSISRMTNDKNQDLLVVKTASGIKAYERKQNGLIETKVVGNGIHTIPIYNSEAKDMQDIFGKTSMAKQTSTESTSAPFPTGINRGLPTTNTDAQRKAREDAERKAREASAERQREIDKRLDEERKQQNIAAEEQAKRQKQIEEERLRQKQAEIEQQELFEEIEKQKRKQQEIKENFEEESDEYGVPLRIIRQQQEQIKRAQEQHFGRER